MKMSDNYYNPPINKIYSFNNYSTTLLVDINIYVTNVLQFILNYAIFSKNWCRKFLKKNHKYKSILNNSTELSIYWTFRKLRNQIILFSRKIKSSI